MRQSDWPEGAAALLRFFYCGDGDTILLGARDGGWGLIDCNLTADSGANRRVPEFIAEQDIHWLEFVCLTHPDPAHYFGMRQLLDECFCDHRAKGVTPRFRRFWDSGLDPLALLALSERMKLRAAAEQLTELYRFVNPLVQRQRLYDLSTPVEQSGADFDFGDFFFVALAPRRRRVDDLGYRTILEADEDWLQAPGGLSSNLSVVLVLMHRTQPLNILFGGGATAEVWDETLASWQRLLRLRRFRKRAGHFSGVKVSRPGPRGSQHSRLYEDYCQGQNTLAILSVGHNDNHRDVLNVLRDHNIRAYATCWRTRAEGEPLASFPLPGEPVGPDDSYPALGTHACSDIKVTVWEDGRLEISPPESLLRLA